MIVIQNEISLEQWIEGINALSYEDRRLILANIRLDEKKLHSSKILLYNSVNQINEHPQTVGQRMTFINFYKQQIKFLQELN